MAGQEMTRVATEDGVPIETETEKEATIADETDLHRQDVEA
jgi:hypothetical protein